DDKQPADLERLSAHMTGRESLPSFTGELQVADGRITEDVALLHARSVAEDVVVTSGRARFNGALQVSNGRLVAQDAGVVISGQALLHSAPLTVEAFKKSFLGDYGEYIVTLGLLLFAFSTAISWSYYGDRAMTYLFGARSVIYYHIIYVVGFFVAAFTDTTII